MKKAAAKKRGIFRLDMKKIRRHVKLMLVRSGRPAA